MVTSLSALYNLKAVKENAGTVRKARIPGDIVPEPP